LDELSRRQLQVFDFIRSHIDQSGVVPSYREIGLAVGIGSTNGVSDHIKALVRKGYLERGEHGTARSIRLVNRNLSLLDEDAVMGVPVLGRIAAGLPLLAAENYEGSIRVDTAMLPPGGTVFALIVNGDSMIEDGILHGDYLFVRQRTQVRDGQIAVVRVDGEATVKRVFREGERLRLQPANSEMEAFFVDADSGDVEIVGEAVGVFRRIP
jgi:repressor LexA